MQQSIFTLLKKFFLGTMSEKTKSKSKGLKILKILKSAKTDNRSAGSEREGLNRAVEAEISVYRPTLLRSFEYLHLANEPHFGERIYDMTAFPRGVCFIINQINYYSQNPPLPTRNGVKVDEIKLTRIFKVFTWLC